MEEVAGTWRGEAVLNSRTHAECMCHFPSARHAEGRRHRAHRDTTEHASRLRSSHGLYRKRPSSTSGTETVEPNVPESNLYVFIRVVYSSLCALACGVGGRGISASAGVRSAARSPEGRRRQASELWHYHVTLAPGGQAGSEPWHYPRCWRSQPAVAPRQPCAPSAP